MGSRAHVRDACSNACSNASRAESRRPESRPGADPPPHSGADPRARPYLRSQVNHRGILPV